MPKVVVATCNKCDTTQVIEAEFFKGEEWCIKCKDMTPHHVDANKQRSYDQNHI